MAERKIVGRKSQMIFHSVIPVDKTHDEVIKAKLKSGKFPFTVTGILKIIGILFFFTSLAIFLSNSICPDTPEWFPHVLPGVLGVHIAVSLLLYIIFSFGLTVNKPATWVKIDIFINFILAIATLIASVLTMVSCNSKSSLMRIPMILGLCGGSISIISCAALFLLYRYREDEEHEITEYNEPRPDPRKSVFA